MRSSSILSNNIVLDYFPAKVQFIIVTEKLP
nr:MAG TPA: hypothetical protein [Caudoviricetes sp.]DAT22589.1 MAG TPA: hypothetical protein [Caudoviricetes sp.]DAX48709.1 MAG TPA: hypothetical protein [Caudoviricetes sp.]